MTVRWVLWAAGVGLLVLLSCFDIAAGGAQARGAGAGQVRDETAGFQAVSCWSKVSCVAVGFSSPDDLASLMYPLAESGHGSRWSIVSAGRVGPWSGLFGVSCMKSGRCLAVGYSGKPGSVPVTTPIARTLIESSRTGGPWSVVRSPSPGTDSRLTGVSCLTTNWCVAVGQAGSSVLIEQWQGSRWVVVSGVKQPGTLQAVSCTSSRDCVAVGSTGPETLFERFTGATWSRVASPNPSGFYSTLSGVSCVNDAACIAVGYTYISKSVGQEPLIERYSNGAVMLEASPPLQRGGQLNSNTCSSQSWCIAVGVNFSGMDGANLAMAYRSGSWALAPDVSFPFSSQPGLRSVSCTQPMSCVAVGSYFNQTRQHYVTAIAEYRLSTWSTVPSPNPS